MRRLALLALSLVLLSACSGGAFPPGAQPAPSVSTGPVDTAETLPPETTTTTLGYTIYEGAKAQVPTVRVFSEPGAATPVRSFANPDPTYGAPLVFLVQEKRDDWLNVSLPARPNGSTGWIRASDVTLSPHEFRIVVELSAHRITVYQKNEVIMQEPVGVGRAATPTAVGNFFTAALIRVLPDQRAAYGPFAFVLSAYSEVLFEFAGGDGQMGIHGTGDPSSVGRDVSSGCIRLTNDVISTLADLLPNAGVPVEIRA